MDRASKKLRVWLVALLAVLGISAVFGIIAAPASAAEPVTPPPAAEAPAPPAYTETQLSNERDLSRWAFVVRKTIAYSQPERKGRKVRRLTTKTPDNTHELVLALKQRQYADGGVWVQVRLPMRGSGRTGWVSRGALGVYRAVRTRLEINRRTFRATLYKNNKRIWSSHIGVGKKGTSTPRGKFYVRDKLTTGTSGGIYGPRAMGLSAYSKTLTDWPGGGIIGIHGTNQPGILPGRVSHGCVRVPNGKIRRLFKLMSAGTPVRIK